MKKILLALIIGAMLATMTACGDEKNTSSEEASAGEITPITAEQFKEKILEKVAFDGEMVDCTKLSGYPLDTMGIASDLYTSHIFLEVSDTTESYETICVFAATSEANALTIKGKLDAYISSLKAQFGNYNQTINDMVNESVVKVDGTKAYLIISPNVTEMEKVITDNIKGFN